MSAREGRFFAGTWIPNDRRRPPSAPRTRGRGAVLFWLLFLIFTLIGLIAHLTGHG